MRHTAILLVVATASGPALASPGTEFWAVLSDGPYIFPFSILVGNPAASATATVTVENEAGLVEIAAVAPGATHEFALPDSFEAVGSGLNKLAYRVRSDLPVHAYQITPFDITVAGWAGSLLIDRTHFGTEFIALAFGAQNNVRPSVVTIVAPGPARVEVTPTAPVVAGTGVAAMAAGSTASFSLSAFDVLQLATGVAGDDLTGTIVSADGPVMVFAGCHACKIGVSATDVVQEAMLPVSTWSTGVVALATDPTFLPSRWRIVASADSTVVTTDPVQPGTPLALGRGQFAELLGGQDFLVTATAPIAVAHYVTDTSFSPSPGGDPAMRLMIPEDLFATDAVFALLETTTTLFSQWVDIIARPGASVVVDGVPVPAASFVPIGSSGLGHAYVELDHAVRTHRVSSDVPVGMYAGQTGPSVTMTFPLAVNFPPNLAPSCDAGGPYVTSCAGPTTTVTVTGAGSSDPEARPLTYLWSSPAPGVAFDDATLRDPRVTVPGLGTVPLSLDVSDGVNTTGCSSSVTTNGASTTPPEVSRSGPPLWLAKRAGDILFTWEDLGGASIAYNLYEGAIGSRGSHVPLRCGEPGGVSGGRRESVLAPSPGSLYFLVSASSCFAEGESGGDPARSVCPP